MCKRFSRSRHGLFPSLSTAFRIWLSAAALRKLILTPWEALTRLALSSIRESEPEKASRPFDKDRDGLVPSGGAATLILESYESAIKRGATILAEIVGYGFSSNGEHISLPNVDGPQRAMEMAMNESGD